MNKKAVYIQMKDGLSIEGGQSVFLKDLAVILADEPIKTELLNLEIIQVPKNADNHIVVSILTIIEKMKKAYPNVNVFPIGEAEILVKIDKNMKDQKNIWTYVKIGIVCIVIFVGSGLALMNFHADVNMRESHRQVYKMITGKESNKPLILQIPYSLGIGVGMAVFFNHILPKKFNNEPSPMEVEMASYRKSMDQYILNNEKNTEEK
ncbi:stage V sporulation protein AA [Inediibacterium massiliense]|uniref:stage V sporulation protein AA n=1 Tax=Inediibacterium massiliense TaxID=1658111 RepID=UPI0006B5C5F6|nr:stage V sporulation protein AA [Inediibacterium massiliense]